MTLIFSKRNFICIFFIIFLALTINSACAHSGRTTDLGCHRSSKTNRYHCHNNVGEHTTERKKIVFFDPYVIDGDTLKIGETRIRLIHIDAPEMAQICSDNEKTIFCGLKAREYLVKLLEFSIVECISEGEDKYGRLLANCVANEIDINKNMVQSGWAVINPKYSRKYIHEQAAAKDRKVGIWGYEFTMPWEWRSK